MTSAYRKPLPELDEEMKPFWDGCKRHELLVHRCLSCGRSYFPVGTCPHCEDVRMEWTRASGRGRVFTFNVFHRAYHPAFKDEVPYNVAIIELEEGALMMSNVVGCKNEDIHIGMPVEVVFEDATEEYTFPKFKPVP